MQIESPDPSFSFFPGLIWIECKQIYSAGAQEHFMQYYNYMDFVLLALYLASYALRFVALLRVTYAARYFKWYNVTETHLRAADSAGKAQLLNQIEDERHSEYAYFLYASKHRANERKNE